MLERKVPVKRIIIHCSAFEGHHDIKAIREWHQQRGFEDVGYHYVITTNGTIQTGRDMKYIGAHVKNHNFDSIGICLCGLMEFSEPQLVAMRVWVRKLMLEHKVKLEQVFGHYEFDKKKTCPNIPTSVLRFIISRNDSPSSGLS